MPPGTPLGHNAFGLCRLATGWVVGTRRHLVKLDANFNETARAELPWHHGRPYRLQVGDVLTTTGFAGLDILVLSANGAMLVFDQTLTNRFVYPEPSVRDAVLPSVAYAQASTASKQAVSVLSERGVVANLTLGPGASSTHEAELHAVSAPFEETPQDLERQKVGENEFLLALVGTVAPRIRCMTSNTLAPVWEREVFATPAGSPAQGLSGVLDMATVMPNAASGDDAVIGEHIVVLASDTLYLFNETGTFLARKDLNTYAPCLGATAIAIGELATGGPAGIYTQEIAIATASGHVVWFHMNEIAAPGVSLPVSLVVGATVQPRTNRALGCTWGMSWATPPGFDVLDQSGVHWRVGATGVPVMANALPAGARPFGPTRGWTRVGAIPGGSSSQWVPFLGGVLSFVGAADPPSSAIYQLQTSVPAQPIWYQAGSWLPGLGSFLVWNLPGDTAGNGTGYEIHHWANPIDRPYADLIDGLYVDSSNTITGRWGTTQVPPTPMVATANMAFRSLRSPSTGSAYVDAEALRAFVMAPDGTGVDTRLALGCPGGSLRILRPGQSGVSASVGTIRANSADHGTGGMALAIRPTPNMPGVWDIFFGTLTGHAERGSYPGNLSDISVLAGTVSWYRYTESGGNGTLALQATRNFRPTAPDPRGGFGVVGLALGNLLGSNDDELVVTTLGGDLFVLDVSSSTAVGTFASATPLYRTWVPGGLGLYNAIQIRDLDPTGAGNELYVASSFGLRKWKL